MQTQSGKLPDFFIVGAAKSATTSLYAYLIQHPSVFMPYVKEFHFFSYAGTEWGHSLFANNLFQYANFFRHAPPTSVMGEASTTYLYNYARTIEKIKEAYGVDAQKIKIIIILRNPADRIFSHYSMYRLFGLEKLCFDDAVQEDAALRLNTNLDKERFGITLDYLRAGMYYEQVRAYKEAFPSIHIILYDDLQKDPYAVMRGIFCFLGVAEDYPVSCAEKYNVTGLPRFDSFNAVLDVVRKIVITRKSRIKKGIVRCVGWLLNWNAIRVPVGGAILRIVHHLRFVNAKKASIAPEARKRMVALYRDDILRLQTVIGRDLSAWLS